MKKSKFNPIALITSCLILFCITFVYAGDCDDNCGDKNPKERCSYYNGPGDHGVCIGWGDYPIA